MKIACFLFLFVGLLDAQTVVPISPTLSPEAITTVQNYALNQSINPILTLASPVASGDLSITFTNLTGVVAPVAVKIDSEGIQITSILGNVATVSRAAFGTVATSHLVTANAQTLRYPTTAATIKALLLGAIAQITFQYPGPLVAAQQAAILAAQQAITATQNATVQ